MKTKEVVDELTGQTSDYANYGEIIERNKDLNKIILAGIKTRGVYRSSYQKNVEQWKIEAGARKRNQDSLCLVVARRYHKHHPMN